MMVTRPTMHITSLISQPTVYMITVNHSYGIVPSPTIYTCASSLSSQSSSDKIDYHHTYYHTLETINIYDKHNETGTSYMLLCKLHKSLQDREIFTHTRSCPTYKKAWTEDSTVSRNLHTKTATTVQVSRNLQHLYIHQV